RHHRAHRRSLHRPRHRTRHTSTAPRTRNQRPTHRPTPVLQHLLHPPPPTRIQPHTADRRLRTLARRHPTPAPHGRDRNRPHHRRSHRHHAHHRRRPTLGPRQRRTHAPNPPHLHRYPRPCRRNLRRRIPSRPHRTPIHHTTDVMVTTCRPSVSSRRSS